MSPPSDPPSGRGTSQASRARLLYVGFILIGVATVLLGPVIPELQERWDVDEAKVASLFLAQFIASSLGSILSSVHLRLSLVAGYGLVSLGLGGLAVSTAEFVPVDGFSLAWISTTCIGLGLGMVSPATNLTVAGWNPDRRGAALATLNLIWGVGAVGCQLIFALFLGRWGGLILLWPLAALTGLIALALPRHGFGASDDRDEISDIGGETESLRHQRRTPLLLITAMMFLYVGVETSLGGWLVAFSDQLAEERSATSLFVNAGFWGALLAGRALAPKFLSRVSETSLFAGSLTMAGGGAAVILAASSRSGLAIGAALAGFGLAPLFPLAISFLTARTASRKTGLAFAVAGLGAAFLPWLTGQVAGQTEELRKGLLVPLVALLALAAFFARLQMSSPERPKRRRTGG